MLPDSFCIGKVTHQRFIPTNHCFTYKMYWFLLNLDEIEARFSESKWWSLDRFNLISIRKKDYVNRQDKPINEKIRGFIAEQTGKTIDGQVYLFTHPRFLGFGFNSVSFYFVYLHDRLSYIVSEINNTPWGEKHLYLHTTETKKEFEKDVFEFEKAFHISPFLPMKMSYQWRFDLSSDRFNVLMKVSKSAEEILRVNLYTQLKPMDTESHMVWKKPFQPLKMFLAIYWQAVKLKLKKVPFFSHPREKQHYEQK